MAKLASNSCPRSNQMHCCWHWCSAKGLKPKLLGIYMADVIQDVMHLHFIMSSEADALTILLLVTHLAWPAVSKWSGQALLFVLILWCWTDRLNPSVRVWKKVRNVLHAEGVHRIMLCWMVRSLERANDCSPEKTFRHSSGNVVVK